MRAPCVGLCDHAPAVEVGHNFLKRADLASVKPAVDHRDTHPHVPDYIDYDAYRAAGGYRTLERLRSGELSARRCPQGPRRRLAPGLRRRGLSDRAQVALGARRAGAAPDGGER